MSEETQEKTAEKQLGRNEPCSCGSGKKYKRCCGVNAAPKLSLSNAQAMANIKESAEKGEIPGFDPSQIDPQWLAGFSQAMNRLPKAQLKKLQSTMQKAMTGKDVSRELAELEKVLPPEFQSMVNQAPVPDVTPEQINQAAESGSNKPFWKRVFGK